MGNTVLCQCNGSDHMGNMVLCQCNGRKNTHQLAHSKFTQEWLALKDTLNGYQTRNWLGHVTTHEKAFHNWSGNVETDHEILYVKNDHEIQECIAGVKQKSGLLTVVGAGHSATPVVCDNWEPVTALCCLAQYSMEPEVADFVVDPQDQTVTVNAGWNLDQVMSRLGKDYPQFIFEAQTAGRIFSIGGLVSMCTHGGCMKSGLIADTVTGLRLINADGAICIVKDEAELRYHRMSMGAFGVLTHVTMRLRAINELKLDKRIEKIEISETFVKDYFKDKVSKSGPLFQQFFFDFHQMKAYYGAWNETDQKRTPKDYGQILSTTGGSRGLGGAALTPELDKFMDYLDLNYRQYKTVVQGLVRSSVEIPSAAWTWNEESENDAFWVSSIPVPMPASHWTAYMIPVDLPDTSNIYKALKVAYDMFTKVEDWCKTGGGVFRPDVALEARFIWSSDSYFAPPFSEKRYSQLYFVVEWPTLSSNLYLTFNQMKRHHDLEPSMMELNKQYHEFFGGLEKGWKKIDERCKPHMAKVFGWGPPEKEVFSEDIEEPYSKEVVSEVLSPDRKAKILEKLNEADPKGIFRTSYVRKLLSYNAAV